MRIALAVLFSGLAVAAVAATPEEAAKLFEAKKWKEAAAAYQELVTQSPANTGAWLRLVGAHTLDGNNEAAFESLKSWAASGSFIYQAALSAPTLKSLQTDPRFAAIVEPLKPCSGVEYRQFDFWLGAWDVVSPAYPGAVSKSRISRINDGCTVLEEYTTQVAYEGKSLNFYDAQRKVWHQTWSDNQGGALSLEGGLQGSAMVLSTAAGKETIQRITWTPLPDGRVRQHWESTADSGKTWTTAFDGYYTKRTE